MKIKLNNNTFKCPINRKKKLLKYIHFFKKKIILLFFLFLYFDFKKNYINFQNDISHKYKSHTKVCLCVIAKKENRYIKEYINHYKKLGYNHIFLYDNNDINDEKFEEVIKNEINENFVSIINYRGFKLCQLSSYYNCYKNNNKKYNWLSFFDSDEYLELKPNNSLIQEFLDNKRFMNCQNIKINWIMYLDNDLIYYENKFLIERFPNKPSNILPNIHIKSTVRGNLKYNYWKRCLNTHTSSDEEFIACSS